MFLSGNAASPKLRAKTGNPTFETSAHIDSNF